MPEESLPPLPEETREGRFPLKQRIVRSLLWLGASSVVWGVPKLISALSSLSLIEQLRSWQVTFVDLIVLAEVLNPSFLLTRLLSPEAFGLMALTNVVVTGMELFLAIGIRLCIIQSDREDETFLNTAWLMQIGLGGIISLGCCLLAYPASVLYREPVVMPLLLAIALSPLINGFASTKIATAERKLTIGRLTLMNLAVSSLRIWSMVGLAYLLRSVWALAVGTILSSLLSTALSHLVLQGSRNRFRWEWAAFWEIWRFTRWILAATVLGFIGTSTTNFLTYRFFGVTDQGVYKLILPLATAGVTAASVLGGSILFPVYAEIRRDQPSSFYSSLRKGRLAAIGLVWLAALPCSLFGRTLVDWLYDDRYAEAGWMLQILAAGALVKIIANSYDDALYARGETRLLFGFTGLGAILEISSVLAGAQLAGVRGVLIGFVLSYGLGYFVKAAYFARRSLWQREVDLPCLGVASLVAALVFAMS